MDTDSKLLEIESRLERMHNALQRQEVELESWRGRSVRVPNWIRNGGVALFMAVLWGLQVSHSFYYMRPVSFEYMGTPRG